MYGSVYTSLAYRQFRFNPHHGKDGKFSSGAYYGIEGSQYAELDPSKRWSQGRRDKAEAALNETPAGSLLRDSVQRLQSANTDLRLRHDIDHALAGEKQPATSQKRAINVVDAIDKSPFNPPTLYRGLAVTGSENDLIDRFQAGHTVDLSLASFSSDMEVANAFARKSHQSGKGGTQVVLKWTGGGKALPIQNLSQNSTLSKEKEWLTNGRFQIDDVRYFSSSKTFRLQVHQENNLHVHQD